MTLIGGDDYLLFRSWDHAFWFAATMSGVAVTVALHAITPSGHTRKTVLLGGLGIFQWFILERVSEEAEWHTSGGKYVFGPYSPDCIWYNHWLAFACLMFSVLIVLRWIGHRLAQSALSHMPRDT